MSRRVWEVRLDGRMRRFEVEHGYWTARRVVRVDKREVLRIAPPLLTPAMDLSETSSEHAFVVDGHECALRVRPTFWRYEIELIVDGRSATDGLPAGPVLPAARGPVGWRWTLAIMFLLVYIFVVVGPIAFIGSQLGPRWLLLANVLLTAPFVIVPALLVVVAWRSRQRGRNVAMAAALLVVALVAFRTTLAEAADLVLPFDEESVEFMGWEPASLQMRIVTMIGGPEVEFANWVKVKYRRLPPGSYVFVRAHLSRIVLDMRPVAAGVD
ncbi:MAG TPA: hypothetical protein VGR85_11620 [Candidatus Limnocylindria bacterium]|nr:hypothetical protein [Candidatus Limnocylindria bacterium]